MASVYRSLIASRSRACLLKGDIGGPGGPGGAAEIPSVRRIVSRMRLAKSPSSSAPSLHFRLPLYNRDAALPLPPDDEAIVSRFIERFETDENITGVFLGRHERDGKKKGKKPLGYRSEVH